MKDQYKYFERATCFIVALFFGLNATCAGTQKTETSADIIEKAQTLSLQKERSQATLLLVSAIKRESKKNPKAAKDLTRALEQISSIFYNDKSQQLYELGISLRLSDPALASLKLADALKLEPENLAVALTQLRISIALGDCSAALSQGKKIKEINPFSEDVDLAISQAAVCAGQFESYQQAKNGYDHKSSQGVHWATVEIEYQFKAGNFLQAMELSRSLQAVDRAFPEAYYWEFKSLLDLKDHPSKENTVVAANKYANLCKVLPARAQRQYISEPFLCRRTAEIENFLKKNNNSGL